MSGGYLLVSGGPGGGRSGGSANAWLRLVGPGLGMVGSGDDLVGTGVIWWGVVGAWCGYGVTWWGYGWRCLVRSGGDLAVVDGGVVVGGVVLVWYGAVSTHARADSAC